MKLIDAFLFFNEYDILIARIKYLKNIVDYFCIVESSKTFTGQNKKLMSREILLDNFGSSFVEEKCIIIENNEYISDENFQTILQEHIGTPLAFELQNVFDNISANQFTWLNDCYQRELIFKCIKCCIEKNDINKIDTQVIISDIDEIPNHLFISTYLSNFNEVIYAEMQQFRYHLNILDKELWIGSFKCGFCTLEEFSINEIRFALKRKSTKLNKTSILPNAGWHFTSFGSVDDIRKKIDAWGHQELNTPINRLMLPFRLRYGFDIFSRNLKYQIIVDNILPKKLSEDLVRYRLIGIKKPNSLIEFLNLVVSIFDKLYRKFVK
jgi:hypothetical protein